MKPNRTEEKYLETHPEYRDMLHGFRDFVTQKYCRSTVVEDTSTIRRILTNGYHPKELLTDDSDIIVEKVYSTCARKSKCSRRTSVSHFQDFIRQTSFDLSQIGGD